MFNLLFKDKKISSFKQFIDNFDLEAVKMYYLGGSLVCWLELCGKSEIAELLKSVDPKKDIDEQLAAVFGQPLPKKIDFEKKFSVQTVKNSITSFVLSENPKEYACFKNTYSSFSAFDSSFSAENGSYKAPSGAFNETKISFLHSLSSFFNGFGGSFINAVGSFGGLYGSFMSQKGFTNIGSYVYSETSFTFGSGSFNNNLNLSSNTSSSFNYNVSSFNNSSFEFSSYKFPTSFISSGESSLMPDSLSAADSAALQDIKETFPPKTPEEKIIENLSYCPLNRFGYGIHLI